MSGYTESDFIPLDKNKKETLPDLAPLSDGSDDSLTSSECGLNPYDGKKNGFDDNNNVENMTIRVAKDQGEDSSDEEGYFTPNEEETNSATQEAFTNSIKEQKSEEQIPLTFEDSFEYVAAIKRTYADDPEKYTKFLSIMRQFHTKESTVAETAEQICNLFKGNKEMILGFNKFLPKTAQIKKSSAQKFGKEGGDAENKIAQKKNEVIDVLAKKSLNLPLPVRKDVEVTKDEAESQLEIGLKKILDKVGIAYSSNASVEELQKIFHKNQQSIKSYFAARMANIKNKKTLEKEKVKEIIYDKANDMPHHVSISNETRDLAETSTLSQISELSSNNEGVKILGFQDNGKAVALSLPTRSLGLSFLAHSDKDDTALVEMLDRNSPFYGLPIEGQEVIAFYCDGLEFKNLSKQDLNQLLYDTDGMDGRSILVSTPSEGYTLQLSVSKETKDLLCPESKMNSSRAAIVRSVREDSELFRLVQGGQKILALIVGEIYHRNPTNSQLSRLLEETEEQEERSIVIGSPNLSLARSWKFEKLPRFKLTKMEKNPAEQIANLENSTRDVYDVESADSEETELRTNASGKISKDTVEPNTGITVVHYFEDEDSEYEDSEKDEKRINEEAQEVLPKSSIDLKTQNKNYQDDEDADFKSEVTFPKGESNSNVGITVENCPKDIPAAKQIISETESNPSDEIPDSNTGFTVINYFEEEESENPSEEAEAEFESDDLRAEEAIESEEAKAVTAPNNTGFTVVHYFEEGETVSDNEEVDVSSSATSSKSEQIAELKTKLSSSLVRVEDSIINWTDRVCCENLDKNLSIAQKNLAIAQNNSRIAKSNNSLAEKSAAIEKKLAQMEEKIKFGSQNEYVKTVKKHFARVPEKYMAFLDILLSYEEDLRKLDRDVLEKMRNLFENDSIMMGGFQSFLPGTREI